jgi:hypothetical protein
VTSFATSCISVCTPPSISVNIFGVSQGDSARTVSCAAWCVRQPANAKLADKSAQAHPLVNERFIE